jgi:hypothetical protein
MYETDLSNLERGYAYVVQQEFWGIEQQLIDDEYNNSNNNTILKREIEK